MPALARGSLTDPANCNRTIPIFDGAARFDMVLSYGETQSVEKPGYKGPVLVCNARYVPIAGHRSLRPSTKFMEDNKDMQVWLAPVEKAAPPGAAAYCRPHHDRHERDRGVEMGPRRGRRRGAGRAGDQSRGGSVTLIAIAGLP